MDLKGAPGMGPPPPGSKFFHFHAVFGQKNRLAHPLWELAPPPGENPGSATVLFLEAHKFMGVIYTKCNTQEGQSLGKICVQQK